MPKTKRHSVRRKHKSRRYIKRGGEGTPTPSDERNSTDTIDRMEKGLKYATSVPPLFNPNNIMRQTARVYTPDSPTISATHFFDEREKADNEFNRLTQLHDVQKSFLKPSTKEEAKREAEQFFDAKVNEECTGPGCAVMGGKKSRRKRRKGRKSRKHRRLR
jgi:hypothetical protein